MRCRTAALGGHLWECSACGFQQPHYNSCRNRGCPNCQALAQARWIEAREKRILPVGHHHVVFTLPSQLRTLVRWNPTAGFKLLFAAVNETLATLAEDVLGVRLGVTAVLHTWTRDLRFHPHVHCVVTAGGLSLDDTQWVERTEFLFPSARMKALFRARLLAGLQRARDAGELTLPEDGAQPDERAWKRLMRRLPPKKKWVVHVEAPFGRSTHVLRYLGRYTHRIAISDQRLVSFDARGVCFRTRKGQTATLDPLAFIGRFLQHVLPRRFHKIRHYGLYASANAKTRLPQARRLLGSGDSGLIDDDTADQEPQTWLELLARLIQGNPLICPSCGVGTLVQRPLPSNPRPLHPAPPPLVSPRPDHPP